MNKTLAALAILFGCSVGSLYADVLYSDISISSNTGDGVVVGTYSAVGASDASYGYLFTPTESGTAGQIGVWALDPANLGADGQITAQIFTDNNGAPGTELAGGTFSIPDTNDAEEWTVPLTSSAVLSSSVSYYAVFTAPILADLDYFLVVPQGVSVPVYYGQFNATLGGGLAQFEIDSSAAAPEPSTYVSAVFGFLVLLVWGWKGRSRYADSASR